MTFRETLRDGDLDDVPVAPRPSGPTRIWGTDGRLDHHHASGNQTRGDLAVTTPMTQAIARALLPVSVMVGAAMLVKGYGDTGDGFSAGVILALGALVQIACFGIGVVDRIPLLRYAPFAAYAGLLLALLIAFVPLLVGEELFTHWPPPDATVLHFGTLEIITAVAFDLAVCLLVFGFVVGTITLLARTASVASMLQAQIVTRNRMPVAPYTARDLHPAERLAAGPDGADPGRADPGGVTTATTPRTEAHP